MAKIIEPQREVEVLADVDVVVVGGGPAGVGAALGAARNGAKTILVERFNCLGGMQTLCYNSQFFLIDPEVLGGIVMDIVERLRKGGWVFRDFSADVRRGGNMGGIRFDGEYYKFLLENMMAEAGVKLLYHAFGVAAIKEGNALKGVIIESVEGRQAILAKVVIDTTGSGDIAWKSGTPVMSDGFPREAPHRVGMTPRKGRHAGFGSAFFFRNVDIPKFNEFRKAHPDDWGKVAVGKDFVGWTTFMVGKQFVEKAKKEGKLYGIRDNFWVRDSYGGMGRIWCHGPHYPLPLGHHGWKLEDLTAGEIDLRKQSWSLLNLLKNEVPGFENSGIEKTPVYIQLRDMHRIIGEYTITEEDVVNARTFDDAVAVSNMAFSDIFGPDYEHAEMILIPQPYDIPYRALLPKETDNLLVAGAITSADFVAYNAIRYCVPSVCTGEAAGTAAALAAKNHVTPRKLDVKLLQKTLRRNGARVTARDVPRSILEEYQQKYKNAAVLGRID